jgi:hypothetical protein
MGERGCARRLGGWVWAGAEFLVFLEMSQNLNRYSFLCLHRPWYKKQGKLVLG